jgi:hypothetical protein
VRRKKLHDFSAQAIQNSKFRIQNLKLDDLKLDDFKLNDYLCPIKNVVA